MVKKVTKWSGVGLTAIAMMAVLLAFGLAFTGCVTFKVDKATLVEETITLESQDVKALGVAWGYTEERPRESFSVYHAIPAYPQAKVSRFTATDKKTGETRECIDIESEIRKEQWRTSQKANGTSLSLWGGVYDTQAEANAAAAQKKSEVDALTAMTIVVEREDDKVTGYTYRGMKPLE